MALGMKHWIAIAVLGVAIISVNQLPPEAWNIQKAIPLSHEETHAKALNAEVRRANDVLKRIRWADDFTAHLTAADRDEGFFVSSVGATVDALEGLREEVRGRLAALPVRDEHAVIGYYWVVRGQGSHPGVTTGGRNNAEYYVGALEGQPYCIILRSIPTALTGDRSLRRRRVRTGEWVYQAAMGPCRLVAQYGAPGGRITAWLEQGALNFGNGIREAEGGGDYWYRRRGVFGAVRYLGPIQRVGFDQCLAGMEDRCLALAFDPLPAGRAYRSDDLAVAAASALTAVSRTTSFDFPGRYIFSDLEQEFGPDAFRHFWQSNQEVTKAFEAAFGVDMGKWLAGWTDRTFSGFRAGPKVTKSARFGGLFTIMLFGLMAGLWNRRRKVA